MLQYVVKLMNNPTFLRDLLLLFLLTASHKQVSDFLQKLHPNCNEETTDIFSTVHVVQYILLELAVIGDDMYCYVQILLPFSFLQF